MVDANQQCGIPTNEEYEAALQAWRNAHPGQVMDDDAMLWVSGYARSFVDRRFQRDELLDTLRTVVTYADEGRHEEDFASIRHIAEKAIAKATSAQHGASNG